MTSSSLETLRVALPALQEHLRDLEANFEKALHLKRPFPAPAPAPAPEAITGCSLERDGNSMMAFLALAASATFHSAIIGVRQRPIVLREIR